MDKRSGDLYIVRFKEIASEIVNNWDSLSDLETRICLALVEASNQQRESDAQLVESYHECPSTNDYNIATAIRNNK